MASPIRTLAILIFVVVPAAGAPASAQEGAMIAGTGATTCEQFLSDVREAPTFEREYFAWSQGYMSGLLMRSPAGEYVDLRHRTMPYPEQAIFLRTYCQSNPKNTYDEGVLGLYKTLRALSTKDRT